MTDPVLDVAVLLRAARHHADLSQRELAAGVSRGLIGDLESGIRPAPGFSVVVRLLAAVARPTASSVPQAPATA
jgi:transcriptional regulator with XRE-family HTH domain